MYYRDVKEPSDRELVPGDTIMYSWPDPLEKRELIWSCGDKKNQKSELVKVNRQFELATKPETVKKQKLFNKPAILMISQ